jgi:hypothetical protein
VTVRVDLVGAKPPVWRRLVLPSTLRLDQLHGVLQAVFDWTDSHLHRFSLDDEAWGHGERYLCPYDVEEGEDDGVPASDVRLDEVLAATGDVLTYLYDYGDDWHHRLVVEQVGPAVDEVRLVTGRGAAPPEDSGGIWDWDADAAPPFDLAEAQAALAVWSATRSMPPELRALQQVLYGTPHEAVLLELIDAAGPRPAGGGGPRRRADGHREVPLAAAPGRCGREAHRRRVAAARPRDGDDGRAVARGPLDRQAQPRGSH